MLEMTRLELSLGAGRAIILTPSDMTKQECQPLLAYVDYLERCVELREAIRKSRALMCIPKEENAKE